MFKSYIIQRQVFILILKVGYCCLNLATYIFLVARLADFSTTLVYVALISKPQHPLLFQDKFIQNFTALLEGFSILLLATSPHSSASILLLLASFGAKHLTIRRLEPKEPKRRINPQLLQPE